MNWDVNMAINAIEYKINAPCKIHPEGNIQINLKNGLYCGVCHEQVMDYEVFRTDADRDV